MIKKHNSGIIIDKTLIINRIKSAYHFKNDAELANFLGIAPNTLTNWKSRNSIDYDLIFTKCVDLNYDWLITGRGHIHRQIEENKPLSNILAQPIGDNKNIDKIENENLLLKELIKEKERTINILLKENEKLGEDLKRQNIAG